MLVLMSNLVSSGYSFVLLICWLDTSDKKSMTIIKTLRIALKYRPSFCSVSDPQRLRISMWRFRGLEAPQPSAEAPCPDDFARVWVKSKTIFIFPFLTLLVTILSY